MVVGGWLRLAWGGLLALAWALSLAAGSLAAGSVVGAAEGGGTGAADAQAPLATFAQAGSGVHVVIRLETDSGGGATLAATFAPDAPGFHLYGVDLPPGTPYTSPRIVAEPPLVAVGPALADQASTPGPHDDTFGILPIYEHPVTLRLPIRLPAGVAGAPIPAGVRVSYQTCNATTCLFPVHKALVALSLPGAGGTAATASASATGAAPETGAMQAGTGTPAAADVAAIQDAVRAAVRTALAERDAEGAGVGGIRWRHPSTAHEAEDLIATAAAAHQAAFLDFTGPSCVNCQAMAKSVLRVPAVVKGWNAGLPITIDTDASEDLANWQQARFHTQSRPLYVRIAPGGGETRWSEAFSPDDAAAMTRFQGFLAGGAGADAGTGSGAGFWLLAILGGLVTLLMPCTYPMVPFTITFFTKQGATGRPVLPLAAFYAAGIVASFVGLGVLITGVLGASLARVAGNPWTNLGIAALFIVLGLGLIGVFLLRLPFGLENRVGGAKSGYAGALLMGLTYALTAFSCAAPFAGSVLAEAVASGTWTRAVAGMAVYGGAIALPFFLLALSPGLLRALPKSGAWLGEFKVVGGLVELGAALKFLAITDNAWGWGVIHRPTTLAMWAALALVAAAYLLGKLRLPGDAPLAETGPVRLLCAAGFLALGIWFVAGVCGLNLGVLESFFPGDAAP